MSFMTDNANIYYEVMPFGLKNTRATYQRFMDKDFKGLINKKMEVFVDDVVVKFDSCEQLAINLTKVFEALIKSNMRLNPKRCFWG